MTDQALLGPWVRRFLLEYLVTEKNLARNTQRSYRDTLCLLLPFAATSTRKEIDQLNVIDVSADLVRLFLQSLEEVRNCGTATRNQRLAAIHSLSRYIGLHSPEHVAWCGQIRIIPPKRAPGRASPILRNLRWTHYWKPRIDPQNRAVAIMRCCCSSTTRAHGPTKLHKRRSAI